MALRKNSCPVHLDSIRHDFFLCVEIVDILLRGLELSILEHQAGLNFSAPNAVDGVEGSR